MLFYIIFNVLVLLNISIFKLSDWTEKTVTICGNRDNIKTLRIKDLAHLGHSLITNLRAVNFFLCLMFAATCSAFYVTVTTISKSATSSIPISIHDEVWVKKILQGYRVLNIKIFFSSFIHSLSTGLPNFRTRTVLTPCQALTHVSQSETQGSLAQGYFLFRWVVSHHIGTLGFLFRCLVWHHIGTLGFCFDVLSDTTLGLWVFVSMSCLAPHWDIVVNSL